MEIKVGFDYKATTEAVAAMLSQYKGIYCMECFNPLSLVWYRKHYPQVLKYMSTTVSPMTATGRLIKAMHPDAVCVFIGPCIAKKSEVIDSITFGGADYDMTYEELASMFEAKNIDPEECTETLQQGSKFGKQYSVSGGVTAAVLETFKEANKEVDLKVKTCSGALECKKALMLLKVGKLPEDFIEGMACVGGCVNGPAMLGKSRTFLKDRNGQIAKADDRGVLENVAQYDEYGINMTRNHQ